MTRKLISFLLATVMMFSFGVTSFALATQEPEIQPYYAYTTSRKTSLNKSGDNLVCKASLVGVQGTTTKIKITMTLEKKVLFWWSEKATWTQTFNSSSGTLSKIYSDISSGTYRVSAEYVAYSGSKSETITDTSLEVKV